MLGVLLFAALLLISGCDSDGETTHNGTGDNNEMPQTIHAAIVFIAAKDLPIRHSKSPNAEFA